MVRVEGEQHGQTIWYLVARKTQKGSFKLGLELDGGGLLERSGRDILWQLR